MFIETKDFFKVKSNIFTPKTLRTFISYSDRDKNIASGIKEALNHYGIQVFLAHDDIPPGEDWPNEIIKNLKSSDIFIVLLSSNFHTSKWTDQETGLAISFSKFIVPVSIDETLPYGFMEKFQAFRNFKYTVSKNYTTNKEEIYCHEEIFKIIEFLAERPEFKENIRDCLITSLENAWTFRDAEKHFELLLSLKPFSEEHINAIIANSAINNQVYNARGCQKLIKEMIEKYDNLIIPQNKERILQMMSQGYYIPKSIENSQT
ncbi:toll/interleukin-1 receptor domain-containing protein [Candidatus Woesearchaeota archaeon]|nr:toll/interleukin-1 receptor domain-containing protein [Candidatus Woesearchaeota archaeon]